MKVEFLHLRDKTQCKGGITVAFEYDPETKSVTRYALSRCSDNDNYNKSIGRAISGGRLKSDKSSIDVDIPITKQEFIQEMIQEYTEGFQNES